MKDGFLRASAVNFEISLGNCRANADNIVKYVIECDAQSVKLAVFPELCVTGYTCGDMFLQDHLLDDARAALADIAARTAGTDVLFAAGCPLEIGSKLYNTAVVMHAGRILGIVPKSYMPTYTEHYEARLFKSAKDAAGTVEAAVNGSTVPFGTDLVFCSDSIDDFRVGFEICEDLWVPISPGTGLALAGALVICNLSASQEIVGKREYRRDMIRVESAKLLCGYLYASSGRGESSTDLIYSGHRLICENGNTLAEQRDLDDAPCGAVTSELDLKLLSHERRRMNTWNDVGDAASRRIYFGCKPADLGTLIRKYNKTPFVPFDKDALDSRCMEIISLQSHALAQRIKKTHPKKLVIGLSGGLDSTLALLVSLNALKLLGRSPADMVAVTSPGPGTTGRTFGNVERLTALEGVELRNIGIGKELENHLAAIGHSGKPDTTNTYENAQARERMQILMDIANMEGGFVVGTPDLSEIALGFSTYGGDHMSMYGVNAGVPKTLIRYLIKYIAHHSGDELKAVLLDISDTPVSPELLPVDEQGESQQHTEKIIGDYLLHDFILYYFARFGFTPRKIMRLLKQTFSDDYTVDEMAGTLKIFFRRFYANQFKRSCMPDGVKIGSVALSPRGDLRLPSDLATGDLNLDID